jgi:hypothetical protein
MKVIDIENTRLILFHKHPVSARMHFLYFGHGGVCAFKPLPKLASIIEQDAVTNSEFVFHPSTISTWGEQQLGLPSGMLQAESEFCQRVEVPKGEITVYLAGFNGDAIPDNEVKRCEAKFITLMECVGIAPVEMLLLQKAYGVIMGGQS